MLTEIKNYDIIKFYDQYSGNFGFTENELFENMNEILMWIENHNKYGLVYQYNEAYEGRCWWLTEVDY